ncbi:DUF4276 family protein [Gloeobacter violaceus]|uniref:Glr1152 protein n=1 Tax=Gloeobacter violaceus (strain ATCC 29082 / PCC 7421) TaxID=251221 RepID=Q7NLH1_GLOVI|nr:DUF4276 family protein [Gloeobacter violaceus]BAC89093.1 glr1152 [Gloeobacter violaceus PCC 7421]
MRLSIAIYVEGGGDSSESKAQLRQGFEALFGPQKQAARSRRLGWKLVMCGSRQKTYRAHINAMEQSADSIVVLLVDAEGSVPSESDMAHATHLRERDNWDLSSTPAERIHLMVQTMESWLIADADALMHYYGQGFNSSALPQRQNLEEEPKQAIDAALTRATQQTQKGEYEKIKHASQLLRKIRPERVAARCPRFARLTQWLDKTIVEAGSL